MAAVVLSVASVAGIAVADATEVLVSSFGYDPVDATAAVQAALDSSYGRVVLDRQAGPWYVQPLQLRRGNKEIVLAAGVELRAKPGAYQGLNDALLTVNGATDVTIRGEAGALVAMNKADYQDPERYAPGEWRHAFSLRNQCGDIRIRDLRVDGSGGDGFYVNGVRDVTLENLNVVGHHRQGISVISAVNLTVRNCDFSETSGTAPACGIDFEPNRATESLVSNVFESCRFAGNAESGASLALVNLTDESEDVSIVFRDCTFAGNGSYGVDTMRARDAAHGVGGAVLFERCVFQSNGRTPISLKNQVPGGLQIDFVGCSVDARGQDGPAFAFSNGLTFEDFGAVRVTGCTAVLDVGQGIATFVASAGAGVTDVEGVLGFSRTDGTQGTFDFAQLAAEHPATPGRIVRLDPAELDPSDIAGPLAPLTPTPSDVPLYVRSNATFLQYVPAAGSYPVTLMARPLGSGSPSDTLSVRLLAPDGRELSNTSFPAAGGEYVIEAPAEGLYALEIAGNGNVFDVKSVWSGHGFAADGRLSLFGGAGREFYFAVRPETEDVVAEIVPDPNEPVQAQLVSPTGEVVADTGYVSVASLCSYHRGPARLVEVWCVRFPNIREDCTLRLGTGVVPVLADAPTAVLLPKPADPSPAGAAVGTCALPAGILPEGTSRKSAEYISDGRVFDTVTSTCCTGVPESEMPRGGRKGLLIIMR